ncbi:MAG: hypothetical protein WD555_03865 [Fulvivirga sp.]
MEEKGFIGRESHKIKFTDISEVVVASILLTKIDDLESESTVSLNFSLLDFYPHFNTLTELGKEISGKKALIKDRNTEYMVDLLNFMFKTDIGSHETETDVIKFYNHYLERRLYFLKNGDSLELQSCIENYLVDSSLEINLYEVTLNPKEFLEIHEQNMKKTLSFREDMYVKLKDKVADIGAGVSYRKQLEFANEYLDERTNRTGEVKFDFDLREFKFRHLLSHQEEDGQRLTLPQALTTGPSERVLLPFFLESTGVLDVEKFKLTNSPVYIMDVYPHFSVTKPAIKNRFLADSYGLSAEMKKSLNETQIIIHERLYLKIAKSACFLGRPKIEANYCTIIYWLLKKVSICLEEPSFLKEKAALWLHEHRDDKYQKIEDDFFLPFLHEKLKDEFGDTISKKPEKFGGEVDLQFDEIPIELKVRKNENESLTSIIDDSYKPTSQAATYAAITRLGFVLVLDVPKKENQLVNLDQCFKVVEKEFEDGSFNTQIVVCTFYCNLPKPNLAK